MNLHSSSPADSISALADGQLGATDAKFAVEHLLEDSDALATWHAYHVAGDVLRSLELGRTGGDDLAFLARFEQRLAQEVPLPAAQVEPLRIAPADASANDAVFRWKALAGVACMALVGVVGLNQVWTPMRGDVGQVAITPAPDRSESALTIAEGSSGTMVRDPQLDALMAAHRQMGGHSALQTPAGYLRNAGFEGPRR